MRAHRRDAEVAEEAQSPRIRTLRYFRVLCASAVKWRIADYGLAVTGPNV
jgi:hypothetical protein